MGGKKSDHLGPLCDSLRSQMESAKLHAHANCVLLEAVLWVIRCQYTVGGGALDGGVPAMVMSL